MQKHGEQTMPGEKAPGSSIKTTRPKKLLAKAKQMREAARQNVIEKGYVHFRVKPEFYRLLFEIADAKQVPLGILCRQWIAERMQQEMSEVRLKTVETGKVNRNSLHALDVVSLAKRLDRLEDQLQRMCWLK